MQLFQNIFCWNPIPLNICYQSINKFYACQIVFSFLLKASKTEKKNKCPSLLLWKLNQTTSSSLSLSTISWLCVLQSLVSPNGRENVAHIHQLVWGDVQERSLLRSPAWKYQLFSVSMGEAISWSFCSAIFLELLPRNLVLYKIPH